MVTVIPIVAGIFEIFRRGLEKRMVDWKPEEESKHSDYVTVKISNDIEKSPGDLKYLAVTLQLL